MQTEFPTVEIYFVFAFTYCKLRVYEKNKEFAIKILQENGVSEFLNAEDSNAWQEIDTRILLDLIERSVPKLFRVTFS